MSRVRMGGAVIVRVCPVRVEWAGLVRVEWACLVRV